MPTNNQLIVAMAVLLIAQYFVWAVVFAVAFVLSAWPDTFPRVARLQARRGLLVPALQNLALGMILCRLVLMAHP